MKISGSRASGHSRRIAVCFSVIAMMAVAGCANSRGGSIPYDVADFGPADAPAIASFGDEYRITPLDTLAINVFQFDDLSGDYQVDLIGNVSMPLIGSVPTANLTVPELERRIEQRLGEKYLQNPDVSVGVKASTQRNVTVDGSVRQPGVFPAVGRMTLIQAIALARGTDDNSNPRRVAVFRTIDGQRQAAAFDLTSIRRGEMQDPDIYAGDIIVVDGSTTRSSFRDIIQTLPVLALFRPF